MSEHQRVSRRDVLAATAGLSMAAMPSVANADAINDTASDLSSRRNSAEQLRITEAKVYAGRPLHHHPTNSDEDDLRESGERTYIASYSKGLPHNDVGEVDRSAYGKLLDALRGGDPDLFERIPLGNVASTELTDSRLKPAAALYTQPGAKFYRLHSEAALLATGSQQMRLVNPQAGLALDLEGADSHEFVMPPAPAFGGKEIIGEIAENYWMALARDVPFLKYADPSGPAADSVKDLNNYSEFKGPKASGKVTADTLFRGTTEGDLFGPFVSQFLLADIPFGAYLLPQKVVFSFKPNASGERDFVISEGDWLARQRGVDPNDNPERVDPTNATYIFRGRDLANFVHIDELFQAYLNAALLLGAPPARGGLGAPHNQGNPYDGYIPGSKPIAVRVSTQIGFGTLGEPNIKSMIAEVATRALKAVWYQKWFVHRRARPEVFAGRVHFHKTGRRIYPFNATEFSKLDPVLDAVAKHNVSKGGKGWFLPMAFPEGSPLHPAYGAGHATVAGACTTLLKGLYEGDVSFADLDAPIYVADDQGKTLKNLKDGDYGSYKYSTLAPKMTIAGELNKVASNISLGRNFAGVHWRSDHAESLRLGEAVALQFLRETALTYNESTSFSIRKFDGSKITISN